MELRHLRYFVAVAEDRSFARAARRLRVVQPALSKQIRNLETELGVKLLEREPRGVRLTAAGEAFLVEARRTLATAESAVSSARRAGTPDPRVLRFSQGTEMGAYAAVIADLLGAFRIAHPDAEIPVTTHGQLAQRDAIRHELVDVAATFLTHWPITEFGAYRLVDASLTGALIPATHRLAREPAVHVADLSELTFLHRSGEHWPENLKVILTQLRDRGLRPDKQRERALESPSASVEIAAGNAWSLGNAPTAAAGTGSSAVVYRPFIEPPLPVWLSLVWLRDPSPLVDELVRVAKSMNLQVENPAAGSDDA